MFISECPIWKKKKKEFSFYSQSERPPHLSLPRPVPPSRSRQWGQPCLETSPQPLAWPCHCQGNASPSPRAPSVLIGWQHLLSCHLASNWLIDVSTSMTSQSVWQQRPCRRSSMVLQRPWCLPASEGAAAAWGLPWALLGEQLATPQLAAERRYSKQ